MIKVKLILACFCLLVVAGSQLYFRGIDVGSTRADDEAFASYVTFAKQLQAEQKYRRHPVKITRTASVWSAVDGGQ